MSSGPPPPLDVEALRRHLTHQVGHDLELAGEPRPISGGFMNTLWRVGAVGTEAQRGDLVLRLFPPTWPPAAAAREFDVHRFVWDSGFPTSQPLVVETRAEPLGAPFMITTFVEGDTLMSWLDRPSRRTFQVPAVLAQTMWRLHRLPLDGAPTVEAPLDPAAVLDDLAARNTGVGDPLVAGVNETLARRKPATSALTVCHLDLNPPNILLQHDRLAAVIDWTNSRVADPYLDVADVDVVLRTANVDLPPATARLAAVVRDRFADRFVRLYDRQRPLDETTLRWWKVAAACRRRLSALLDAEAGAAGEPRGFTNPEFIAALGRYAEANAPVS